MRHAGAGQQGSSGIGGGDAEGCLTRRRVLGVIGAMGLGAIGGCGMEDGGTQTRLELWTLALRPRFTKYMEGQIAAFERAHAGVRVDWVDVPYDALERKLIAAAAAGRAPDVVNMADLNFARFAALGAFADITEKTPGSARERYVPGALGMCLIGGRVMALPWYVNPQARIVNAELLERGGLDAATLAGDWRGLIAQAPEFKRRTGEYLFSQPLGEESQIPIMMLGEGLVPLREEGGRLVADLMREEIVEYVRRWVGAYREGWLPREAATKGHAHLTELYQEGRLAVINTGPNFVERIRDVSPRVFGRTMVLRGAVGELGRVHMPVMVLAVVSQSRQMELAAKLAWHLTGPEAELALSKMVAVMPSAGRRWSAESCARAAACNGPPRCTSRATRCASST